MRGSFLKRLPLLLRDVSIHSGRVCLIVHPAVDVAYWLSPPACRNALLYSWKCEATIRRTLRRLLPLYGETGVPISTARIAGICNRGVRAHRGAHRLLWSGITGHLLVDDRGHVACCDSCLDDCVGGRSVAGAASRTVKNVDFAA